MFLRATLLITALGALAATANPTQTRKATSSKDCKANEFYYPTKSCCLPHGGPSKPPSPPPQKQCPPSSWYWNHDTSCCVPAHPPSKPNNPPPQCNKSWEWNKETQCCEPHQPPPPSPPKPSGKPQSPPKYPPGKPGSGGYGGGGYGGSNSGHWKRFSGKSRDVSFCPSGFEACPISSFAGSGAGESECVDTYSDLTSCGGCASLGHGQNCATIPGAWNVGCEVGQCKIYTCSVGYKLSQDGSSCVML